MNVTCLGRVLALVGLGSTLALAQSSGFDARMTLRTAVEAGNNDQNLNKNLLSLGFDCGYTTAIGRFGAELGYQYKPGKQYLCDVTKAPVQTGVAPVDPAYSVDSRKATLQGFAARLSYEKALTGTDFSLRAGLQVARLGFRQEVIGTVSDGKYREAYNATPTKSSVTVSPFVGVSYAVNAYSSLELQVLTLGYKSIDYVHVTTGQKGLSKASDYVTDKRHYLPHVEIGYTFRF